MNMNNKELKEGIRHLILAHNRLNPLVNTGCMIIPLAFSYPMVADVFIEVVDELGFKLNNVKNSDSFSNCSSSIMIEYDVRGVADEH
jgi:hypothetical protein